MLPTLSFNNISKTYLSVMGKGRPYWASKKREILTVPGKPGGYLSRTITDVLMIPVQVLIEGGTPQQLRTTAEDLANWLNVDEPAPLVFSDEPDRTYYAVVDGSLDPDELVTYSILTITFLCPDPHKYGPERSHDFSTDVGNIVNNGSANALPVFTAFVESSITNLDIVSLNGYMRIGAPAPVDLPPVSPTTLVVDDEMETFNGWTQSNAIDNGTVTGAMKIDGNGFMADLWGEVVNPPAWQGPSMARGFPSPLQDFMAEIDVQQLNDVETVGMIEVYFRDATGNVVAKLGIEDSWRASKLNRVKFQLGPIGQRKEFARTADTPRHWDDFIGVLRIRRKGTEWQAYFAKKNSRGEHHTRAFIHYSDGFEDHMAQIASVQVAFRKWGDGTVDPTVMRITRLQVWRLNQTASYDPLYIANAGDVIVIDHRNGSILINGEPRLWLKDFGSTFFPLLPGENPITFSPTYAASLQVAWRDRYV